MNVFSSIGNFLLSEWLWNVTRDWSHIPISIVLCGASFKWILRMRKMPSLMIAFFSYIYGLVVYSLFIVGVLLYLFDFSYTASSVPDYFYACFYLGLIFTVLQSTFYCIVHQWYRLNIPGMIFLTFLANSVAAIISYYLLADPLL